MNLPTDPDHRCDQRARRRRCRRRLVLL